MALTKKLVKYLDSLPDEAFIYLMFLQYGATLPKWERCSKEEYEKYMGKVNEAFSFNSIEKWLTAPTEYRKVPYWKNGGGILDQISNKEPDGYYYEKVVGYERTLLMGRDMVEYCSKRPCMEKFFKENN